MTRPSYYRVPVKVRIDADAERATVDAHVECFDVIDALGFWESFGLANVLKYLWRAGRKTPDTLDDLRKAKTYLEQEIARRERATEGGDA